MVVLDEHPPFGNRQLPDSLLAKPGCVERDFEAALAIGVGARIHRVRQNMIYPVHVRTRKSFGLMTRKLSVTESRKLAQFLGTLSRKKSSVASAKCPHVA